MSFRESISVTLSVLGDWRMILVTIVTILTWALLRYVGMVYRRKKIPGGRGVKRHPSAKEKPKPEASSKQAEKR
jgi:hypothetical protein